MILEKSQYTLIYKTSFLILIPFCYAIFMNKNYWLSGSIFLTSVNYWRKPDYSYRRYLDIVVVTVSVSYQHYIAFYSKCYIIYFIFAFIGKISYLLGKYYYNKNNWLSTYFHMGLHLSLNIASLILYSDMF